MIIGSPLFQLLIIATLLFVSLGPHAEGANFENAARLVKPFAPLLGWFALASSPIYGHGSFDGKAAGLGSMTEFATLENRNGPTVISNEYIVAPRGVAPRARVVEAPTFAVSSDKLYELIQSVMSAESNIEFIGKDPSTLRVEYVQRTPIFRFPDVVTLMAVPQEASTSSIAVHSYSIYGAGDLGVNKARVLHILDAVSSAAAKASP